MPLRFNIRNSSQGFLILGMDRYRFFLMSFSIVLITAMLMAAMARAEGNENNKGDFVYDSKGKKDPFAPPEFIWTPQNTIYKLRDSKLDGILWDETNPMVIMDGQIFKKGDTYLGATIESIEQDHAVFAIGGEKIPVYVVAPKQ